MKRSEDLSESERDDLRQMLEYLPELSTLQRFARRIYRLFDTPKDLHQARCRRAAIVQDWEFQSVPELVKAMEQLSDDKFAKLMEVRYKWRRRKTLVRFVVLTLDAIWSAWSPAKVTTAQSPVPVRSGQEQSQAGQESRHAA